MKMLMTEREEVPFDKIGTGDLIRVSYLDGGANGGIRCLVGRASIRFREASWLSERGDVLVRRDWSQKRIIRLEKASRRLPDKVGVIVGVGEHQLLRGVAEWFKMGTMETVSFESAQRLANLRGWATLI